MPFIYKTTNIITNKIYIGKSKFNDPLYLGSGLKISAAIKKYGKDKFTKIILEECSQEIVSDREIHWISFYNSTDDIVGYNISKGGEGGSHYWDTLSDEERINHNLKISIARKGQLLGPRSEDTKIRQSLSFKNYADTHPDFFKKRALAKCKNYVCIDHSSNILYRTNNLKEFCNTHSINFPAMAHNARTRKNLCNKCWSCSYREFDAILTDNEIIEFIVNEYNMNNKIYREKISNSRKNKNAKL
jgi:hypothetical protein